jgi:hypothetical protein
MYETSKIEDTKSAEIVARRQLEIRFGRDKIRKVTFLRVEYSSGKVGDFWEVEGDVVIKIGLWNKESKHFRYRIDSETGRVIGFEIS